MEAIYGEIAQLIRRHRERAGLSTTQLARKTGEFVDPPYAQTTISGLENGHQRISIHVLDVVAKALGVEFFELLPRRLKPKAKSGRKR